MVIRADGSWVHMRHLNVGDQILVAHQDADGGIKIESSPVLAIDIYQHYNIVSPVLYREIHTMANHTVLHITPAHSLLVKKKQRVDAEYIFASEVDIGDYIYILRDDYQSVEKIAVTGINDVQLFDAFAPLTFQGNLIINHVVVSCYGTFTHSIGHIVKMPRRWWLHWHLDLMLISL
jgi:hypothetical protein